MVRYVKLQTLVIALLFLAACAAPQSDTVRIGFIGPLTGNVAPLGQDWRDSVQMAVDDVNAAGGISGRMVEVFFEDGACLGQSASKAYQKLRNVNNVDAVIPYCSPEVLSIAPIAAEDNTLIVTPGATSPDITTAGKHVFRLAPSDNLQGVVGANLITDKGYERVAILYINNDYGAGLNRVISQELGDRVVLSESFTHDGAGDVRTQLSKLKNVNPDVIYMAGFPREGTLILEQLQEAGIDLPIIASEAIKGDEILPIAEGILITVPSGEGETFADFAARFEERFGRMPQVFSGESYDAVNVIAQAITNNPDDPVVGMQRVGEYTGVAGHVVFDENGDVVKPYDLFTVEGEAFVKLGTVSA